MLCLHFSIGATNDIADQRDDHRTKPYKPLPAGVVTPSAARGIAVVTGLGGVATAGLLGPPALGLALVSYAAGLAYNAVLKRRGLGWVAYTVHFATLPVYAWVGAAGRLPPRPEVLLPVAALAGPVLALANALVDRERDDAAGTRTVAVRLGRARSLGLMGLLLAVIHAVAWVSLVSGSAGPWAVVGTLAATTLAIAGLALSARREADARERGWQAQAVAVGLLAVAWVFGAVAR